MDTHMPLMGAPSPRAVHPCAAHPTSAEKRAFQAAAELLKQFFDRRRQLGLADANMLELHLSDSLSALADGDAAEARRAVLEYAALEAAGR